MNPIPNSVTAALNSAGVGRFQWYLLGYTGLAWAGDACETMILSYLGPSVACAWPDQVGPFHESLLTSVVFAGMMVGVYTLGSTADALGRRKGFMLSASLLGIAGLASAAAPSFTSLLLLRTIVGAALGGTPIAVTLFSEFLPTAKRGSLVLLLQACWTLGTLGTAILAWAVLPTLGWRWLLVFAAIPMFILLSGYPFLPESPHWLMAQGRMSEATAVLEQVARINNGGKLISKSDVTSHSIRNQADGSPALGLHRSDFRGNDDNVNDNVVDFQNGNDTDLERRHLIPSAASAAAGARMLPSSSSTLPIRNELEEMPNVHTSEELASYSNGPRLSSRENNQVNRQGPRRLPTSSASNGFKNNNSSPLFSSFFIISWFRQLRSYTTHALSRIFSPQLARTTSLLWGIWFVNALTYYGLVLLTTTLQTSGSSRPKCTSDGKPNFAPSDYAAVLITTAAEAPGLAIAALLVDGRGRVWCIRAGLAACAACVLGLLGVNSYILQLALLFVARACIEGTFSVLYVYSPELYPTTVRSTGLALCNAFSRLGGFAAPFATVFLVESGRTGTAEMLLGGLLCVAAAAAVALPIETKGVDLGEADASSSEVVLCYNSNNDRDGGIFFENGNEDLP